MNVPPDEPDQPPAGEEGPAAAGPDAVDAGPEGTEDDAPERPLDEGDAAGARGLVVVGEHPDVPAAAAPPRETAGPVVVAPVPDLSDLEDEPDPARRWKIAAAALGVAVIVLAAVAIERGSGSAQAGTAVTPEQETALENVVTVPANELAAKKAQLEQLQKDSAAAASAAEQAATDNAALQQELDDASPGPRRRPRRRPRRAAQQAITDANRSGASAAEANRQVAALTKQVESLNRQIGSLTAQTDGARRPEREAATVESRPRGSRTRRHHAARGAGWRADEAVHLHAGPGRGGAAAGRPVLVGGARRRPPPRPAPTPGTRSMPTTRSTAEPGRRRC